MKNKDRLYTRKFLNGTTGTAMIEIDVTKKRGGNVMISDCSRQVNLDFDVNVYEFEHNTKSRSKKLRRVITKKFDVLIDSLTEARDFINSDTEE